MHRRTKLGLAAIVAIAAVVRVWGLWFGLPNTNARPDETIIIDVSHQFLRGNFHPDFFDYPWLYMWTLAALDLLYFAWGWATGSFHSVADLLASWKVHWAPFFLITRGFSAAMGVSTVLVVFWIARKTWDEGTALIAALFIALAFLHVRDSHFGTTDITMTCLLTWSVGWLMQAHRSKRRRDFIVAGLIGGAAAATKYNAALLIVPLVVSYLLNVFESPGRRRAAIVDARLFEYGLPYLAVLAIGVPFLIFDLRDFLGEMHLLRESMQIGSRGLNLSIGWIHHTQYSLRFGLGTPLLVTAFAGAVGLFLFEFETACLLLSFPIAYFAVAGSVRNLFFRYAIPMVPFLCLAAARILTRTLRRADYALIAAIVIIGPSVMSVIAFDRLISRTDNRVVIARWFDQHVADGSTVMMTGSPYGYVQFTRSRQFNAWLWDRRRQSFIAEYDGRPAAGLPEWVLLQDSPLPNETQDTALATLQHPYALVRSFDAFNPNEWHVYDLQDEFFAPYAGFDGVERPGPNYTLYRRSAGAK